MAEYSGISGNSYRLQSTPFAGGGEGDVYNIDGAAGFVAKIYKADKRTTERERKLSVMVSIKPSVMEQYAWPLDVLYENGQFIGYVMPKISGKEKLRNIYVYDKRKGKPWSLYIAIAKNLAAAVHNVHEIHQVIGDLNPENILVNPNDGMVTLVDTDSYHISDLSRTYRCGVGMPEFIAPELQGIHFPSAPLPTFTPESDRFALAVLIFALLMNGAHPFSCKVISGSSSKFQPIDNMQNGKCAFFQDSRSSNMDIPRYAPDLESLPENIQQLFRRAFVSGHGNPTLRPSAEEWYNALEQLEANLKTCYDNTQHIYYYGAKTCPWCEVDKKMHSIPQTAFNSSSQSGSSSGSYSRPATAAGPAQKFTPSNYRYTPSSSNSGASIPKKSYSGWIALGVVVLILILIIRSCANSTPKSSVEILTGDSTVTVGETVQIRIRSTTNRVTANYDADRISIDWGGTQQQSGGYYLIYANVSGISAGSSTLKIYITGNESVYDTISVSVKSSSTSGAQTPQNPSSDSSQTDTSASERNDGSSAAKAIILTANSATTGSLKSSSDVLWYILTLDKPGTITFNMQYPSQESAADYWYLYVYTVDDSSSSIMRSTYSGQAAGFDSTVNSDSQLLGLDAGTYYVKITDAFRYSSSTYTLTPIYTETALCEMEPNNGYSSASVLTLNQPHVGCLSSSDDVDWYKITLDKPGTITFNMQYPSQESAADYWYLYVYTVDDSSSSIMRSTYSGQAAGFDSTVNSDSQLLGLDAGTYYVKITDAFRYSSSTYTLTPVYTETALCEMEPNNGYNSASALTLNQPYVGCLSSSDDVDWYKFTMDSAGTVTFSLQYATQESAADYWYLYVYSSNDSSNSLLRCAYSGNNTTSDGNQIRLEAGTYYVKITDAFRYSSSQYTLMAQK